MEQFISLKFNMHRDCGRNDTDNVAQTFVEVLVSSFRGHDPSSGSPEKATEKTCHHLTDQFSVTIVIEL
jgi:hypothetical protein